MRRDRTNMMEGGGEERARRERRCFGWMGGLVGGLGGEGGGGLIEEKEAV